MPSPIKGEDKNSFISRAVRQLIQEGRPQKQAVAIANSMWDRRRKHSKGKKK